MTAREDFIDSVLPRFIEAEIALHDGNVGPRLAMWSRHEPVTLFGAGASRSGWSEIEEVFRWLATTFVRCLKYELEVVAVGISGDLAYTVAYERYEVAKPEGSVVPNTLRTTHVFRREGNEWKIVHRHGDQPPEDHSRAVSDLAKDPGWKDEVST